MDILRLSFLAGLAQLVEQLVYTEWVGGSNPSSRTRTPSIRGAGWGEFWFPGGGMVEPAEFCEAPGWFESWIGMSLWPESIRSVLVLCVLDGAKLLT